MINFDSAPIEEGKTEKLEDDLRFKEILKVVRKDEPKESEEGIMMLARGSFQTLFPEDFEKYTSGSN